MNRKQNDPKAYTKAQKDLKDFSRVGGQDAQKNETKAKEKKRRFNPTAIVAAVALIAVAVYILGGIYVTKTMTWNSVFASVGLEAPGGGRDYGEGEVRVAFLAAGQADCSVIIAGDTVVVIDAGDYMSVDAIFAYLDQNGIKRIDYLFATHPHADHIGGMADVIKQYEVGQVYFTNHPDELTPTNYTYTNLLETLARTGTPVANVREGMVLELDLGSLTVVYNRLWDDLNDCSTILRYEYGDSSFLFMADAERPVERDMLALGLVQHADVLKAGHHGTSYATSAEFLAAVAPRYVVASCGINNSYGYPKPDFMQRVADQGAALLRTDTGTVVFGLDANRYWIVQGEDAA